MGEISLSQMYCYPYFREQEAEVACLSLWGGQSPAHQMLDFNSHDFSPEKELMGIVVVIRCRVPHCH